MRSYEIIIMESLKGSTPKEKFEYLRDMQQLLQKTAFPGRGTQEESWRIMDVVKAINDKHLVEQHENYNY